MSYANQQILDRVSEEFTRKDLVTEAVKAGYAPGKADQILERLTITGEVKRVDKGKYQKAEPVTAE